MSRIAIIAGSTRPGRYSRRVADWVHAQAAQRDDAEYELVDLADHPLPLLDEPIPASAGQYQHDHTRAWSAVIGGYDGFVFVTPEYNHGVPAVLKNAIDYLYAEWNNKAAAFVSYGVAGGARAVEHLRGIAAEVQLATVNAHVALSFHNDFENFDRLIPQPHQVQTLARQFDQLVGWTDALAALRAGRLLAPAPVSG